MQGICVPIDYDVLAEFLLSDDERNKDNPQYTPLDFERARQILQDQVDGMLDLDPGCFEDSALTELLLEHFWIGTIDYIKVTRVPGVVVMCRGHKVILPLVLIKLKY